MKQPAAWRLPVREGLLALAVAWVPACRASAPEARRTATVERRAFVRTLRLHGVVEASRAFFVAAPRLAGSEGRDMVLTRLARPGSEVGPGDLLAEFDRQQQLKGALEREGEFLNLEEQIKKKRADQAATRAQDETSLEAARNALQTAELEMRKNEVLSRIDAEKNVQNLEEAKARLAQVTETNTRRRDAERADLRILEIRRDRARQAMDHARGNAGKMRVTAPLRGLVVLNTIWKGQGPGEVEEGDQVWPGQTFMQVIDPAAMRVRVLVNQTDIQSLREGQAALVRLDAYPDLTFPGTLERIAAIAKVSDLSESVRTFAAVFALEGKEARLLPDLSAAVDVELVRQEGVLVAPRDTVGRDPGPEGKAFVRVARGAGFDRLTVKTGVASDHEIVLESGVEAGAVLLRGGSAGSAP